MKSLLTTALTPQLAIHWSKFWRFDCYMGLYNLNYLFEIVFVILRVCGHFQVMGEIMGCSDSLFTGVGNVTVPLSTPNIIAVRSALKWNSNTIFSDPIFW